MIREDRELLAELARLNTAMASLALRIMDGSASATEQQDYAQRLIAAGKRLQRRADEMHPPVIEGEVLADVSLALPAHTVEPPRESLDVRQTTADTAPAGRGGQPGLSPSACCAPISVLDPHVGGTCVLRLDEVAATQRFDVLRVWLG